MIKLLSRIWHGAANDDALMLDHLPVNLTEPAIAPTPPKPAGTTLEEAKKRHSKTFKAHVLLARETPPSRDLIEMNELSAKSAAKHTVTAFKKEGR